MKRFEKALDRCSGAAKRRSRRRRWTALSVQRSPRCGLGGRRDGCAGRTGRHDAGLVVSSGRSLLRVDRPGDAPAASFDAEISALVGLPDGGAALGLADGRIVFVGGQYEGKTIAANPEVRCITALAAARDGALLVANGSATHAPSDWKRDLMGKNASGSVWRLEPVSGTRTQLAANLAYPHGLLEERDTIVVSESWRCALTRISQGSGRRSAPVLETFPAIRAGCRGARTMRFGSPCSRHAANSSNSY